MHRLLHEMVFKTKDELGAGILGQEGEVGVVLCILGQLELPGKMRGGGGVGGLPGDGLGPEGCAGSAVVDDPEVQGMLIPAGAERGGTPAATCASRYRGGDCPPKFPTPGYIDGADLVREAVELA